MQRDQVIATKNETRENPSSPPFFFFHTADRPNYPGVSGYYTRTAEKRKNAGEFGQHGKSSLLHKASLSGREGALVNDVLGVLLFNFAGAVQRGAGKGHETCVENND